MPIFLPKVPSIKQDKSPDKSHVYNKATLNQNNKSESSNFLYSITQVFTSLQAQLFYLFAKYTFLHNIKCYFRSFAKMHIYKVQIRLGEKIAKIISKSMVCKTITSIPKHHYGCIIAESIHFEAFLKKIYKCQSISLHMLYSDLIYLH